MAALLLHLLSLAVLASRPADTSESAPALMARFTPEQMERRLAADRTLVPPTLTAFADALAGAAPAVQEEIGIYLASCARARSRRLGEAGVWSPVEVEDLLVLQLVHPERFASDAPFRSRVLRILPQALDPSVPPELRDEVLHGLEQVRGIDFAASEAIESAWGAVPRRSSERRTAYPRRDGAPRFGHDAGGAIAASIYSLPSFFFTPEEAAAFLAGVRAAAPERTLIVLADLPMRRRLEGRARGLGVHLLETYGRPYSPWPRDPFSLVRTNQGGVLVLVRPHAQAGREEDLHLGPELVQNLPAAVDKAWGGAAWAEAPVPFHNGQVLLTPDAAWVSLHTLEPRILALLGLPSVPVETFGTAAGVERYLGAARTAARELEALYGRPVRFVHPLPDQGTAAARSASMRILGGGAGYDLDSILTLLPRSSGGWTALAADVSEGRRLLARLSPADRDALARYGLELSGDRLAAALTAAQEASGAAGLDAFLDQMAQHLEKEGLDVRRLPLLAVPTALLRDRAGLAHGEFLLTWNNVVLETRSGTLRAEGFSSLLPSGDRHARETFAAAGCRLDLLPPLVRSVVLNGGYRCASNHVRAEEPPGSGRRNRHPGAT